MIDEADRQMKRWASWVLEPTPGLSLGYGTSVMQRIVDGKGQILPSAPGGQRMTRVDLVAQDVEAWLKTLGRSEKYVVKLWYLSTNLTVEQKAQRLHISRRAMYDRIEKMQRLYQLWLANRDHPEGNDE